MTNKETSQQLNNQDARLENILYLAAMATDQCSSPDPLADLITDERFEDLELLFGVSTAGAKEVYDDHGDEMLKEWIVEQLHIKNRLGFLIQIATPVMTKHEHGRSYSWGHYNTKWVYGETLELAIEEGLKWVAERRVKEDEKFEAKQGEAAPCN